MSIQERSRNYAMITYHPQEVIEKVLQGYMAVGRIRHYAWIVHDKDMDGDGKLKEKHIHLLLNLNNAMTVTAVRSLFPDGQNTLAQVVYDRACSFDYLIHNSCGGNKFNASGIIGCQAIFFMSFFRRC